MIDEEAQDVTKTPSEEFHRSKQVPGHVHPARLPSYRVEKSNHIQDDTEPQAVEQLSITLERKNERVNKDDHKLQKLRSENRRLLDDVEGWRRLSEQINVQLNSRLLDQEANSKARTDAVNSRRQILGNENALLRKRSHGLQTQLEGGSKQSRTSEHNLQMLTTQNEELKRDLSALRRAPQELSDEALCDAMNLLAARVQSWVVKSLKKVRLVGSLFADCYNPFSRPQTSC